MTFCQLAQTYAPERLSYPCWADRKVDGLRLVVVKRSGTVTTYTRSGRIVDTVPSIAAVVEAAAVDDIVLDGEVAGQNWGETQHVVAASAKRHSDDRLTYHVFDVLPLDVWDARGESAPYSARMLNVGRAVRAIGSTRVVQMRGRIVTCEAELGAEYRAALADGDEGVVAKRLSAPYRWRRTADWAKRKPCETWDAIVVDAVEGTGKLSGTLGSLVVRLPDHERRDPDAPAGTVPQLITSRVGSGFTMAQRNELWGRRAELRGLQIEIAGQELTALDRVRHSRFVRLRAAE